MKDKIKIVIKEDTLTEYFDYIYNTLHETTDKELKKQARILTGEFGDEHDGYIAPNMTVAKFEEFNPNLFMSGQDDHYWKLYNEHNPHGVMGGRNASGIEITYTGMRIEEYSSSDPLKIWWEFAEDPTVEPAERELKRDYSFFQETGMDPIAKPKQARAKGAIALGVREGKHELLDHSTKYLESIMKRGGGDIPPRLI